MDKKNQMENQKIWESRTRTKNGVVILSEFFTDWRKRCIQTSAKWCIMPIANGYGIFAVKPEIRALPSESFLASKTELLSYSETKASVATKEQALKISNFL